MIRVCKIVKNEHSEPILAITYEDERPKDLHWLQKPVIPFMILAVLCGSVQVLWQVLASIRYNRKNVVRFVEGAPPPPPREGLP